MWHSTRHQNKHIHSLSRNARQVGFFLSFVLMCCCPAAFFTRDHSSGTLAFEEVVAVLGRMSASATIVPRVVRRTAEFFRAIFGHIFDHYPLINTKKKF